MKYFRLLYLIPTLLIMLAACKVSDSPTGANDTKGNITTTIAGIVNDENGQPIEGATVTANGKTTTTSEYGTFMIQNATVPSGRCFILCKKNGYFTGSRAETPIGGGITELRLTMQSNAAGYSVDAASGGKITVGGASVTFLPASLVTTNGTPFTGTAKVAVKFLDPVQNLFYNSFSGDMTGKRLDGSQTELLSYGVLRVQITDASGNELKLAVGKTATLTYPIASSMQKNAPASMPLWFFDETLGMWKEESTAVKSGDVYTGEVSHFTDWNLDIPTETGIIKGRVVCNSEGVKRILVNVGQRLVLTDTTGYFSSLVPKDMEIKVSVNPLYNNNLTAQDNIVPPLSKGEERSVLVQMNSCPSYIVGNLIDCNGVPTAGLVVVLYPNGLHYQCTTTGEFKISVPSGVPLFIAAIIYTSKIVPPSLIGTLNPAEIKNIGSIFSCKDGENNTTFKDLNFGSNAILGMQFSPDGSMIAVLGTYELSTILFMEVYDTQSGTKLCGFSQDNPSAVLYAPATLNFSNDNQKFLFQWLNDTSYVINPRTGSIIRKFSDIKNVSLFQDGTTIVASTIDHRSIGISLYSITDGTKIRDFSFPVIENRSWNYIGLSPNDRPIFFTRMGAFGSEILQYDFIEDKIHSDVKLSNAEYVDNHMQGSFSTGFSSDNSVVVLRGDPLFSRVNFYDSETGAKFNESPYHFPYMGKDPFREIGIASKTHYVIQPNADNDPSTFLQPEIRSFPDAKLQKVVQIPMIPKPVRCLGFKFSNNAQYLAGIIDNNYYPDSLYNHNGVIRIWKVK